MPSVSAGVDPVNTRRRARSSVLAGACRGTLCAVSIGSGPVTTAVAPTACPSITPCTNQSLIDSSCSTVHPLTGPISAAMACFALSSAASKVASSRSSPLYSTR
jgi:hypothetical protein